MDEEREMRAEKRDGSPVENIRKTWICYSRRSVGSSSGKHGSTTAGDQSAAAPRTTVINSVFSKLYREKSPSVVTVRCNDSNLPQPTFYGTGFVVHSDESEKWAIILTTSVICGVRRRNDMRYSIRLKDGPNDYPAEILLYKYRLPIMLLVIKHMDRHVAPLTLSNIPPVDHENVCTIGAMATTKLNSEIDFADQMIGYLGIYLGVVSTPSCDALSSSGDPIIGTDSIFIIRCPYEDEIVQMHHIDDDQHDAKHTCNLLLTAPIFRETGEVIGIIGEAANVPDVKHGLTAKVVMSWINYLCNAKDGTQAWKGLLEGLVKKKQNGPPGTT